LLAAGENLQQLDLKKHGNTRKCSHVVGDRHIAVQQVEEHETRQRRQPARRERKPMMIPVYEGEVPSLTTEQMIEVDRAMVQDLRIELIQMMENAGLTLCRASPVTTRWGAVRRE
jgi:hypothetical protein